jgi:chromate transporter
VGGRAALREVAALFLRLGMVAFGGPYAHAAVMEQETVQRAHWLEPEHFAEGMALCNALPGPMSTQLAIWLGTVRAGSVGGIIAGLCFVLPACILITILAALYLRLGKLPALDRLFFGLNAAVIAVILATAWRMTVAAIKKPFGAVLFALSLALALLHVPLVWILVGAAAAGLVRGRTLPRPGAVAGALPFLLFGVPLERLAELAWVFLRAGALLYGGGFVIVAFIEQDVVRNHAWLTQREFLDSVALGQITPGPILVTAAFIGFKVAGTVGAVVALTAVFLPSFVYILAAAPRLAKWRSAKWFQDMLTGVNPAVAAALLAAAVLLALGPQWKGGAIRDPASFLIFAISLFLLERMRLATPWVLLLAATAGVCLSVLY